MEKTTDPDVIVAVSLDQGCMQETPQIRWLERDGERVLQCAVKTWNSNSVYHEWIDVPLSHTGKD